MTDLTAAGAPKEKILDRVRKMLTLANDDAATDGERDNALRMAHATLAKHQLTLAELTDHERELEDPRGRLDVEGWNLTWCRQIRNTIAKLFFCQYFTCGKINATKGRHAYVGRASNAATAAYMSDWIISSVLKEADKRYGHRLTPEGRSFAFGVAIELGKRVEAILVASQKAVDEVATTGTALVVADYFRTELEANNEWLAQNVPNLRNGRRPGPISSSAAYYAGKAHGATINLSKQLGGGSTRKRLT